MGGAGGGEARDIGGRKDDEGGKVSGKITVWSWDVAAKAMKRLAGDFEKRHPGTTVDIADIGYDNAYDKITVGLRGGSGLADVLTVEGSYMPRYIGNFPSGFYDLTSLGGRYGGDFDRAAWRTVTGKGSAVFALPWDIGPCALYCRTDHFRAAGVDPTSLLTWDDYVAAGVRIKKATGRKLLIMDSTDAGILPMLLQQQGQSYFRGGRVAVDTPEAVKALTLMKTLHDKGLVDYEKGWDGLVTGTKEGKAVTTPTAAWWTGTLTDEMPELKGGSPWCRCPDSPPTAPAPPTSAAPPSASPHRARTPASPGRSSGSCSPAGRTRSPCSSARASSPPTCPRSTTRT